MAVALMANVEDLRAQYIDEAGVAVDDEDFDNHCLASEEEDDDDVIDLSQAAADLQGDAAKVDTTPRACLQPCQRPGDCVI